MGELRSDARIERFPVAPTGPVGQIILAKDFDTVLGTGGKMYLDLGSEQGIKAGDYFRIVRFYDPSFMEPVDRLSYQGPYTAEDTQTGNVKISKSDYANLPRRTVGQAVVLMANPGHL
jgi:hypothetical protein